MNRRNLLTGGLATGAALALPRRSFAMASGLTPYQQRLVEVAKRERDRAAARLWRTDVVGIADFALPSARPRLHFVDLEKGAVRSFLVAHGRGSDPEHDGWLKSFSNLPGSEATSRGSYLTCEWYMGKYGTSIRLVGMDADNSAALERAIVFHAAWYATSEMAARWGKLGRSEGCFAMGPADFNEALWHLSGGRLLFADRIGEAGLTPAPLPVAPAAPPPVTVSGADNPVEP